MPGKTLSGIWAIFGAFALWLLFFLWMFYQDASYQRELFEARYQSGSCFVTDPILLGPYYSEGINSVSRDWRVRVIISPASLPEIKAGYTIKASPADALAMLDWFDSLSGPKLTPCQFDRSDPRKYLSLNFMQAPDTGMFFPLAWVFAITGAGVAIAFLSTSLPNIGCRKNYKPKNL